jgi:hypothetical protein
MGKRDFQSPVAARRKASGVFGFWAWATVFAAALPIASGIRKAFLCFDFFSEISFEQQTGIDLPTTFDLRSAPLFPGDRSRLEQFAGRGDGRPASRCDEPRSGTA